MFCRVMREFCSIKPLPTPRLMKCRSRDKLALPTRTHGLVFPWHSWQLLSLCLFFPVFFMVTQPSSSFHFGSLRRLHAHSLICNALQVQNCLMPLLHALHPVTGLYFAELHYLMVGAVVVLWFYLGFTDPAAQPLTCQSGPRDTYCTYCNAWYSATERKHCHSCNKCIVGFDHHQNLGGGGGGPRERCRHSERVFGA